jgi:chromosome segregation ATPase
VRRRRGLTAPCVVGDKLNFATERNLTMSEETTENLGGRNSFESRVLAALASLQQSVASIDSRLTSVETRLTSVETRLTTLETRVAALEEKVDARLQETRPIWEAVLSRLELIDSKLHVLNQDMLEMRGEVNLLKKRQPPAA